MSEKLQLTISLLISNRSDTVRKCLDSVKPILEAIPSELILTDTGCGKQVRAIIEEYTDHIIDFEWCKDFSKARNVGLHEAKGEWFLFLDDDEWFEDVTEIIDFFRSGEYRQYGMAAYSQRNYGDRQGLLYEDLVVGRMIRLDPGVEFMYSIHEVFNCVPGRVKKLKAFVHHYGYVYDTEEERMAHSNRNISLLLEEHEKHPENMKHTLQLIKEYWAVRKFQESLDLSWEGIEQTKKGPVELDFCVPSFYVNIIDAYTRLGREDDIIETAERFLKEAKLDPLAKACIYGQLTAAYLNAGNTGVAGAYEQAIRYAQLYWDAYELELKQDDIYIGYITSVTTDCFAVQNRNITMCNALCAAIALRNRNLIRKLWQRIDRSGSQLLVNNALLKAVVDALLDTLTDNSSDALTVLMEIGNEILKWPDMMQSVRACVEKNISACAEAGREQDRQLKIQRASELETDDWYFVLLRIVAQTLPSEELEQCNRVVWQKLPENLPYIVHYRLWEYLPLKTTDGELTMADLLAEVPLYRFRSAVASYCGAEKWESVNAFHAAMAENVPDDNWYYAVWLENYLHAGLCRGMRKDSLEEDLYAYASCVREQAYGIYQSEILEQMPILLPASVQAALRMEPMEELMKAQQYGEVVQIIKDVRELLPEYDNAIRDFLIQIDKQMREAEAEQSAAQTEMQMLSIQLKDKIRQLAATGDVGGAMAIAEQLAVMLPNDKELQGMLRTWKS